MHLENKEILWNYVFSFIELHAHQKQMKENN